jgi:mono/diheme cytochrome c family protein
MKMLNPAHLLLGAVLTISPVAAQQADQPSKTIKSVTARDTGTLDGKTMFHEYCAVCHGDDAKGNGPAAEALKKAPADLTQVARKNGGTFPEVKVMRMIRGDDVTAAHGSRAMPIWGNIFNSFGSKETGELRVNALMNYVKSIQAK